MNASSVEIPEVRPVPFGRYELLGRLGEGGMAEVFLARQRGPMGFEKLLVVKKVHAHLTRRQQFIDMFLDEARIAARINNPRVVHIYELGQVDGHYYMAMEYLAGESLSSVLSAGAVSGKGLPCGLAARIVAWVAEGLHAAHELRGPDGRSLDVVHRDVSPSNVIVLFEGGVKVVDFGVAKARGRIAESTAGEIKGKFAYMSPEQVEDKVLDRRADVFALGVVLWESLAMRRLFKGKNDAATLNAIRHVTPVPPSTHRREADEALDRIALKALAKDPDERYQSCEEFRRALEGYLFEKGARLDTHDIADYMGTLFSESITLRRRLIESLEQLPAPGLEQASDLLPSVGTEDGSDSIRLPLSSRKTPSDSGLVPVAGVEAAFDAVQDLAILEHGFDSNTRTVRAVNEASTDRFSLDVDLGPPVGGKRGRVIGAVVAAAGAAIAIVVAVFAFGSEGSPGESTSEPDTALAGTGEVASAIPEPDHGEVVRLLDAAEQAIRTGRFTNPPGHNALELIIRAEELDADFPRTSEVRELAVSELLNSASRLWKADRKPAARALYLEVLWFDAENELALERGRSPKPRPVVAAGTPTLSKDDVSRLGWLVNQVELAVLDRRFVAPPGHNALEYLVELRRLDPGNHYVAKLGERVARLMDEEAKRAPDEAESLSKAAERLRTAPGDSASDTPATAAPATAAPRTAAISATASSKVDRAKAKELVKAGNGHLTAGRYADARKSFQAALEADARSHTALAGLAAVAFEGGDMARAILYGKRAVKLAPRVARYHMTLAKAYYDLLRYKDAIAHWEKALEIDPKNAAAKRNIESARARMR